MLRTVDDLTDKELTHIALCIYDTVHILGRLIRFSEWWQRFRPKLEYPSAIRAWERMKANWRVVGLDFELVNLAQGESHAETYSIVLKSSKYAMEFVDGLIGSGEYGKLEPHGDWPVTRLFPGKSKEEIVEFLRGLGGRV